MDLVENLIRENIIPSSFKKNQTLYSILITHIILYMLHDLNVPDTAYQLNARDEIMIDLQVKNKDQIEDLEYQTGINLEHYYKLKIENKQIVTF